MKRARLGDRALAALVGLALFVAAAFPLALVRRPPLQDYGEHLAAAYMMLHPGDYPEYVPNGLLKTNSAFVAFASLAGRVIGLERAGVLFVALVLAVNAFVLPRFVLHFGGRGRMLVASLLALPFVHNWFVSMGMLNFSLGVSLSLAALVALDRQRRVPSLARGAVAAVALLATWYAHPVPVLVAGLLAALQVMAQPDLAAAAAEARRIVPAVAPAGVAVIASTAVHLRGAVAPATGAVTTFQSLPWLVYDLWAHWAYGYTPLSATSLVLLGALTVFALGRARAPLPFFGALAMQVLLVVYLFAPYQTVGIGYAGSRIVPYLWMGALLRVPERIAGGFAALLGALGGLYALGMAIDAVRLARDEAEFAAGTRVVGRGSRLDVFDFSPRVTSVNTWSLSTGWGNYVTRCGAHTWEMPGDTPSLPFRWRDPPPRRLEPAEHARFMDAARTEAAFCAARRASGLGDEGCAAAWRAAWADYYREVDPYVDALLMWDPPPDALSMVPRPWAPALHQGRLWVFERASGKQAHLDVDASPARGAAR